MCKGPHKYIAVFYPTSKEWEQRYQYPTFQQASAHLVMLRTQQYKGDRPIKPKLNKGYSNGPGGRMKIVRECPNEKSIVVTSH